MMDSEKCITHLTKLGHGHFLPRDESLQSPEALELHELLIKVFVFIKVFLATLSASSPFRRNNINPFSESSR